jgi:hypothetical protein
MILKAARKNVINYLTDLWAALRKNYIGALGLRGNKICCGLIPDAIAALLRKLNKPSLLFISKITGHLRHLKLACAFITRY